MNNRLGIIGILVAALALVAISFYAYKDGIIGGISKLLAKDATVAPMTVQQTIEKFSVNQKQQESIITVTGTIENTGQYVGAETRIYSPFLVLQGEKKGLFKVVCELIPKDAHYATELHKGQSVVIAGRAKLIGNIIISNCSLLGVGVREYK